MLVKVLCQIVIVFMTLSGDSCCNDSSLAAKHDRVNDCPWATAIADVSTFMNWKDVILLYDETLTPRQRRALTFELAARHIGSVMLQVNDDQDDVISIVMTTVRATTISTVILCVTSATEFTLLDGARQEGLLYVGHTWLVACSQPPPDTLTAILHDTSHVTNVAMMIPLQQTSNTSDSSSCLHATTSHGQAVIEDKDNVELDNTSTGYHLCSFDWTDKGSLVHVGSWTSTSGLKVTRDVIYPNIFYHFNNATLRVGVWEAVPFLKRVRVEEGGGVVYEGFCMDLLDDLASTLNFTYQLLEPPDGLYGAPEMNGSWNGMVGMLLRGELDLAIGPITITPERKSVIDFTVPFMEDGGGILTKGGNPGPDMMNVFRPFPLEVWLVTGGAVLVTGCIMFVILKAGNLPVFSVVTATDGTDEPPWTLMQCMWIIFGSLVSQGAWRHPTSSAGRLVLGCWWLFTILIVSIYTATLAAMLTVTVQPDAIDSIDDLTAQSDVYREIGQRMAGAPVVKVNADAMPLVRDGTAAFILDTNQISYLYMEDCQHLHMANTIFNNNGLGLGLPKHAHYREALNDVILRLQEGGFLEIWRQRWWSTSTACGPQGPSVSDARQLDIVSIGGILMAYGLVIVLAVLCLVLQRLIHSHTLRTAVRNCQAPPT